MGVTCSSLCLGIIAYYFWDEHNVRGLNYSSIWWEIDKYVYDIWNNVSGPASRVSFNCPESLRLSSLVTQTPSRGKRPRSPATPVSERPLVYCPGHVALLCPSRPQPVTRVAHCRLNDTPTEKHVKQVMKRRSIKDQTTQNKWWKRKSLLLYIYVFVSARHLTELYKPHINCWPRSCPEQNVRKNAAI